MNKFSKKYSTSLEESIILPCDCNSEVLIIDYDTEFLDQNFYLAIFSHYYDSRKLPFFRRLSWAFHTLITGRPYSDQIILTWDQVNDLRVFFDKCDKHLQKKKTQDKENKECEKQQ